MTHSPQHLLEVRGLTKAYGAMKATNDPVSYTHLTLPTIYSV